MFNLSERILFEDDDIIVIDKPSGLIVHPDGRTEEASVSGWFAERYPESRGVGEKMGNVERPGIIHRIDRGTSGALILAKTPVGHKVLKEQFQSKEVEKIYHLFVYGNVKNDFGSINLPIGRSAADFRKRSGERDVRGVKKEALTHFKVLKRSDDRSFTFVEAKPKTGRTHQIRVHFKALGHPVICDKLYAPKKPSLLGFDRLALHARSIAFKTVKGEKVCIEAPYPADFLKAMDINA